MSALGMYRTSTVFTFGMSCKCTHLYVTSPKRADLNFFKLAIHLSFLVFRHVRALFRELFREIVNQSLYTSHNIADFVHL